MGRGSRNAMKQRSNQPLHKKIMDSEDSDEDYVAEVDEQSDDLDSLVGDGSAEESFFEELEEEKEDAEDGGEGGWRSVVESKTRAHKGFSRSRKNDVNRPKKRRKVIRSDDDSDDDDSDDDDFEYLEEEKEDEDEDGREGRWKTVVKTEPRARSNRLSRSKKNGVNRPKKRRKVIGDDGDDSDDDEFSPDEFEYLEAEEEDEDEELEEEEEDEDEFLEAKSKTRKRVKSTLKRENYVRTRRTQRSKSVRKPSKSRTEKNSGSKAKSSSEEEFLEKDSNLRGRAKGKPGRRKKRMAARSDSDICSDPADCEFTISEEEREQVREANLLCRNSITNLRSSRKNQEGELFCVPKKQPARKGKEKAVETKNDKGKPVCGICLTEEGKSSLRGTLNCCSHYFCFACIMEWSKVETRCPLCKQRFVTISKPTKCGKGFDLRNAVVTVPERDQVYQPSEEELRDFRNPYENVICTECNQGGDDALMLLCDVCDSPAHTYCVGLGHEVPEGNWYCDGCRPAALASSDSQFQDFTDNQRSGAGASGHSSYENMAEIDLNVTIPETPFSQGDGFLSPRLTGGSLQLPSPVSGIGVSTVSGRRRIHHQIQYILSNRMSQSGGLISSIGNILGVGVNTPFHQNRTEEGTSHHGQQFDRVHENYRQNDFGLGSLGNLTGHVGQPVIAVDDLFHGHRAWDGLDNIPLEPTQAQSSATGPLQPCTSRSSIRFDVGGLSSQNRKEECTNFARQEVHSVVRNQLRSMPREINLDHVGRPAVALYGSFYGHRAWNGLDSIHLEPTQAQLSDTGPIQACSSRSSIGPDTGRFPAENRKEECKNFVRQEVHSIMKNQLRTLPRNMNLGQNIYMDISSRSEHAIMAAFGLELSRHDTLVVQPPICTHPRGILPNVESSPLSGCCLVCFRDFVTDTVRRIITDIKMAPHRQDFGH